MNQLYETPQDNLKKHLESDRLILRAYQEGDEGDFFQVLIENKDRLDPASSGRLGFIKMLDDARIKIKQLQTDWNARKLFSFGIWLKDSNTYIGDITLKNIDLSIPKAEVGFYIDNSYTGKGYAAEALKVIIAFAFNNLKLNKLYGRCTEQNTPCSLLFEHAGFMQEGYIRQDIWSKDNSKLLDLYYYGMTRAEFDQATKLRREELTAVG
ncbi:MAG: GNAT family N-acetyltransferase [Hymenobacteraceae bacterium]|nr:GNAT family N-acetyltransferase [Hymenobacteraceae bacterium]MDX5396421.1 GNAT family N-acetyltransferase [Hymenobacteraceae bacterium]MDX5442159.1 GNAT family N-acetyltransferase [Hymenobacteraceae bacterium]MDX5512482.1 GNAT family N-acetyltransferase [Hymenobacteraceae bacterium]